MAIRSTNKWSIVVELPSIQHSFSVSANGQSTEENTHRQVMLLNTDSTLCVTTSLLNEWLKTGRQKHVKKQVQRRISVLQTNRVYLQLAVSGTWASIHGWFTWSSSNRHQILLRFHLKLCPINCVSTILAVKRIYEWDAASRFGDCWIYDIGSQCNHGEGGLRRWWERPSLCVPLSQALKETLPGSIAWIHLDSECLTH